MKKTLLKKLTEKLSEMRKNIEVEISELSTEMKTTRDSLSEGDEGDVAATTAMLSRLQSLMHQKSMRRTQIQAAFNRIENGTYGICIDTGEDIEEQRLLANPLALRSLEAQEDLEKEQKQRKLAGGYLRGDETANSAAGEDAED